MSDIDPMLKKVAEIQLDPISTNQVLYVPMLSKIIELSETDQYDNDKLKKRKEEAESKENQEVPYWMSYQEEWTPSGTTTGYSIEKQNFNPNR